MTRGSPPSLAFLESAFVIIGTDRDRKTGAMLALLARAEQQGLAYAGAAFIALCGDERDELRARLESIKIGRCPLAKLRLPSAQWVKPHLVARVRQMTAAKREFHLQSVKEAIDRMRPELIAASEAAHRMKEHDDPGIKDLDRTMELGSLVDVLVDLCAPHLRLLNHIAEALAALEAGEGEGEGKPAHRH
jgi:hypothetical protein